ncbi:MAG: glycosyltransferase, partial [Bacteroidota bacterium]|nr:glycosyltransferase [Bacteroidota bacterium]
MLFAFRRVPHNRAALPHNEGTLPLTIVMFIHNEEGVLENSLSALITCPGDMWNAEFIIISDASTDGSHAVIERFQTLDKRFTLIQSDERLGKPGQWHKYQDMLRARKGYLLCLDADVVIQSEGWGVLHRLVQ